MNNNDSDETRRDFLVNALTLGLITGINAAGFYQPVYALGGLPGRMPEGRSIYKLSGHVLVDGQVANIKTQIGPNSSVQTGEDSEVIFVVAADAFILRSNSELLLGAKGLLVDGMRLVTGAILSVFGERKATHQVVTPVATIGIRGTGIYVDSEPDRTYVCTCYGRTRIIANSDPNIIQDIETEKHDEPVYVLPAAAQQKLIIPAPVIDHADSELNLIEALVGRKTPFGGAGYKADDYDGD